MACEAKESNLEVESLQLIDFLAEDDYLVAYPFRDSLEDLRLSVTFENINEHERFKLSGNANSRQVANESEIFRQRDHIHSESMEPQRPSFLRKSLAWDSAFFTSAGVLDPEELFMINKGFKKSDADLLPGIQEDLKSDSSCLEFLEGDLFEDGKSFEPGLPQANTRNILSSKKMNIFSKKVKLMPTSKSQSLTHQGLERMTTKNIIHPQTSKHAASSEQSNMLSPLPPKLLGRPNPISARQTKRASLAADKTKMENKTRKAGSGPDVTVAKKSRLGDLSGLTTSSALPLKSASLTSLTSIKDSTLSCSYESSSSVSSSKYSSKSMRKKSTKPTPCSSSIHLPLMSNWSSSTTPASSTEGWSSSPAHGLHTPTSGGACLVNNIIQASDLESHSPDQSTACRKFEETKITSQCSKRALIGSSPNSAVTKRNVKSSGLRMPSPKIGFFDEDQSLQPTVKESVQFHFGGQSPLPNVDGSTNEKWRDRFQAAKTSPQFDLCPAMDTENRSKGRKIISREHDRRKVGVGSNLKPEGQRTKVVLRNKTRIEQKKQENDIGCVQGEAINLSKKKQDEVNLHVVDSEKENLCSFEDQVNGLSRYFEVINLESDVVIEVKGKPSYSKQQVHEQKQALQKILSKPTPVSLPTRIEPTPCTRTPFAIL